jgi:predicted anti-sigma-YlaC factor YlaD
MSTHELTCREFAALVTQHLEGALSPADEARFTAHVQKCDDCQAYIDQLRVTIQSAGTLSVEEIPEMAMNELLRAFRDWNSSGQSDSD